MKTKSRFSAFLLYLLVFVSLGSMAQTGASPRLNTNPEPEYQAGKIYLKIKSSSSFDLAGYPDSPAVVDPDLVNIMNHYRVTRVEKPFVAFHTDFFDRAYRITFDEGANVNNLMADLSALSYVEFTEKVPAMYQHVISNDPVQPYHLNLINANGASNIHISTGTAVVAVVDDAVLTTHQDLAANMFASNQDVANLDANPNPPFTGIAATNGIRFTHGTHVAGIAGGVTNNSIGIASIGWNNSIMGVKTRMDNDPSTAIPFGYDGITWAATNGADVINMSWGGSAFSLVEYNVVVAARSMDIVLVASAGNDYTLNPRYPAAYGEGTTGQTWEVLDRTTVIAVAGLDANNDISNWGIGGFGQQTGSNYGFWVDISAYGTAIMSSISNSSGGLPINNQYTAFNGTSMAAPQVSGVAGIMRSLNPGANATDVYNCLVYTANPDIYHPVLHPNNIPGTLGTGRLDAQAALQCIDVTCVNPIAVIIPSSYTICPSSTVTLTANTGISYLWSTGATTQSINVTTAGVYTVTVTFPGGCTATTSVTITNADNQAHIVVTESSGLNVNDGILCGLDMLQLSSYFGMTYAWSAFGATTPAIPGTINAGSSLPFAWTVCVTITGVGGCPGVTDTDCVNIQWLLPPTITVSPTTSTICAGQPVNLTAAGGVSYSWLPTTALSCTNCVSTIASPTANTTYTVTGFDAFGCSNTATSLVNVTNPGGATFSYPGSPYCIPSPNPFPAFAAGSSAGTFSSTAGLVFVSTATGQVNIAASTPGTYTVTNTIPPVGGCPAVIATSTITIIAAPIATFNYSGSPFCSTAANPSPVFTGGGTAGVFSSTAGLVFVSTATGQINLSASTPGTYTVTNTIAGSGGCPGATATATITISGLPVASFNYSGSPYCSTASNPFPTFSGGGVAGTFSSTTGLVFVSTASGQVNLSASTPGTYTVTNTIPASGGCPSVSAIATITINVPSVATFSYTGAAYCTTAANPFPTFSGGGVAGTFSSTLGLVFVSTASGQVNLSASTPGTYTVTNTIPASGGCPAIAATATITITAPSVAAFSYTGSPYCSTAANPLPTFSGGGVAGTFSSTTGLVFVSTSTGQVNLSASTPGTYTVTNTIAASGGCPAVTATATITITAPSAATFSYTGSPYCTTAANPFPTFSTGSVAGTFSSTAGLVFVSTSTGQVNVAASTPGTYTVTNTIPASGGCPAVVATSTITITVCATLCSTCTALPATLAASPAGFQVYCVNTPLTITGAVTFALCEVKMSPGMTITVNPGATLTISGSHFYSCGDMWQGIVVRPGGRVVVQSFVLGSFINRSSLVEDARVAIDIQPGSTLTTGILGVSNATFNRNEVSIRVAGYTPLLASYPFSVVSSIFTCRDIPFVINSINWPHTNTVRSAPPPASPLVSPYINNTTYSQTNAAAYLKPPFPTILPGTKSRIAIDLIQVGNVTFSGVTPSAWYEIKIGNNGPPNLNVFDNHTICINAVNANFTSVNNVFQYTINTNNVPGTAILAVAKELNFRAQVIAGTSTGMFNNRFYDCTYSINTTNYFENTFTHCDVRSTQAGPFHLAPPPNTLPLPNHRGQFGFYVTTNRFRIVNMSDNKLYNIENAINFKAAFGSYNIGGVVVSPPGGGQYSGQVNVDRNEIAPQVPSTLWTTQFVRSAISVENVLASGLQLIPGATVAVNNNRISNVHKGILISNWQKKNIINNSNTISMARDLFTTVVTQYGIKHDVNIAASSFGISINSNTITGTGFLNNHSVYGIITTKCVDQRVACNLTNGPTHGIEFASGNPNTRFDHNTMTNNFYGYVLSSNGIIGLQGTNANPSDNTWTGTWTGGHFKTATLSGSSSQNSKMYIRTSSASNYNPNGSGTTSSSPITDLYNFTNGSLILASSPLADPGCAVIVGGGGGGGIPASAISLLEDIARDNIPFTNNADETRYINKNQLYRLLKSDPVLTSSSAILQGFYNSGISTTLEILSSIEDDIALGDLSSGQSKTDALAPVNNIERNYKEFFNMYLKYQTDSILPEDSSALFVIASGCPFTDGTVVYQARTLYNTIYRTNIYFEDNCKESTKSFIEDKSAITADGSFDVLIYPNPNAGTFSLVPFNADITELNIKAVDVNGKTVFDKTISSGERMFNLNLEVPNGIYMLSISDSTSNERIVKRIVIQK